LASAHEYKMNHMITSAMRRRGSTAPVRSESGAGDRHEHEGTTKEDPAWRAKMDLMWDISVEGVRLRRIKTFFMLLLPIFTFRGAIAYRQEGVPLSVYAFGLCTCAAVSLSFWVWWASSIRPGSSAWDPPSETARKAWDRYNGPYLTFVNYYALGLQVLMLLNSNTLTSTVGWWWKNPLFFILANYIIHATSAVPGGGVHLLISLPITCLVFWFRTGALFSHTLACTSFLAVFFCVAAVVATTFERWAPLWKRWLSVGTLTSAPSNAINVVQPSGNIATELTPYAQSVKARRGSWDCLEPRGALLRSWSAEQNVASPKKAKRSSPSPMPDPTGLPFEVEPLLGLVSPSSLDPQAQELLGMMFSLAQTPPARVSKMEVQRNEVVRRARRRICVREELLHSGDGCWSEAQMRVGEAQLAALMTRYLLGRNDLALWRT